MQPNNVFGQESVLLNVDITKPESTNEPIPENLNDHFKMSLAYASIENPCDYTRTRALHCLNSGLRVESF